METRAAQLFRVLPNFHECFYNSIKTRRACFLFLLENTTTHKRKTTCLVWSKCKFSFLAPSLRQKLVLVLCFYRVMETRFLTNQRAGLLIMTCSPLGLTVNWLLYKVMFQYFKMKDKLSILSVILIRRKVLFWWLLTAFFSSFSKNSRLQILCYFKITKVRNCLHWAW